MFCFIIPLKNPSVSGDWERCQYYCELAVRSALNHRESDCRVVVVGESFDTSISDRRLIVVERRFVDPDPVRDPDSLRRDKHLKIKVGLVAARKWTPFYFMKMDADDLVSSRLVPYVLRDRFTPGYCNDQGYYYHDGSDFLAVEKNFHLKSGTSSVLFADKNDIPVSDGESDEKYPLLGLAHHKTVSYFEGMGSPLRRIPFRGVIYRKGTGDNISDCWPQGKTVYNKPNWKFYVGLLWNQRKKRLINRRLSEEFQGLR